MCLGIPGQIVEISNEQQHLAVVDVGGVRRTVNIACIVDEHHPVRSCAGEWVLVHVGFALSRLDSDEAQRTIELFNQLSELQAEVQAIRESGTG